MRHWLIVFFTLFGLATAHAEIDDLKAPAKPVAPVGLTQEQFDALVKAVSDTVTKTLQEQKSDASGSAAKNDETHNSVIRTLAAMVERAPAIASAFPAMIAALERLPVRLDRSAQSGLSASSFVLALLGALAAMALTERIVRRITQGTVGRMAAKVPDQGGLKSLLALNLVDLLRLFAIAALSHMIIATWFANASYQSTVMTFALENWMRWRIVAFLAEAIFRPSLPAARIAQISDRAAQTLTSGIIVSSAIVTATRFYGSLFAAPAVVAAALLLNTILVTATYVGFLYAARGPLTEWFSSLVEPGRRDTRVKLALAQHWFAFAIPLLIFLAATRFFGAMTANVALPAASAITMNIVLGFILFETLLVTLARRPLDPLSLAGQIRPFLLRAAQVIGVLLALLYTAQIWAVGGLSLIEAADWHQFVDSWRTVAMIVLIAFFAWEAVRFITTRYGVQSAHTENSDDALTEAAGATRLQTLMPPFRVAMAVAICLTALLMILSSLGVNTTPLIAGASVFGLAISFGSQTLVKDIVSGIFFLADDAFRVGEYIDCKSVKGTVEGFTLRSIKLRHQNGQIHTVPFGQLGQITNFSRDWSTVKFNIRFARDTDVDALRKATKKLGQDLAQDPELKDQFLTPLKLQGVADIDDTALIMRFKFTVKPINPGFIQRIAVKRMIAEFPAQGLHFASSPGYILQAPQLLEMSRPITSEERPVTAQEPEDEAALAPKIS